MYSKNDKGEKKENANYQYQEWKRGPHYFDTKMTKTFQKIKIKEKTMHWYFCKHRQKKP